MAPAKPVRKSQSSKGGKGSVKSSPSAKSKGKGKSPSSGGVSKKKPSPGSHGNKSKKSESAKSHADRKKSHSKPGGDTKSSSKENVKKHHGDKKKSVDAGKKKSIDAGKKKSIDAGKKKSIDAGKKKSVDAGKRKSVVDTGKRKSVDAAKKKSVDLGKKKSLDAGKIEPKQDETADKKPSGRRKSSLKNNSKTKRDSVAEQNVVNAILKKDSEPSVKDLEVEETDSGWKSKNENANPQAKPNETRSAPTPTSIKSRKSNLVENDVPFRLRSSLTNRYPNFPGMIYTTFSKLGIPGSSNIGFRPVGRGGDFRSAADQSRYDLEARDQQQQFANTGNQSPGRSSQFASPSGQNPGRTSQFASPSGQNPGRSSQFASPSGQNLGRSSQFASPSNQNPGNANLENQSSGILRSNYWYDSSKNIWKPATVPREFRGSQVRIVGIRGSDTQRDGSIPYSSGNEKGLSYESYRKQTINGTESRGKLGSISMRNPGNPNIMNDPSLANPGINSNPNMSNRYMMNDPAMGNPDMNYNPVMGNYSMSNTPQGASKPASPLTQDTSYAQGPPTQSYSRVDSRSIYDKLMAVSIPTPRGSISNRFPYSHPEVLVGASREVDSSGKLGLVISKSGVQGPCPQRLYKDLKDSGMDSSRLQSGPFYRSVSRCDILGYRNDPMYRPNTSSMHFPAAPMNAWGPNETQYNYSSNSAPEGAVEEPEKCVTPFVLGVIRNASLPDCTIEPKPRNEMPRLTESLDESNVNALDPGSSKPLKESVVGINFWTPFYASDEDALAYLEYLRNKNNAVSLELEKKITKEVIPLMVCCDICDDGTFPCLHIAKRVSELEGDLVELFNKLYERTKDPKYDSAMFIQYMVEMNSGEQGFYTKLDSFAETMVPYELLNAAEELDTPICRVSVENFLHQFHGQIPAQATTCTTA